MLLALAALLSGLTLLVYSADRFVFGASGLAYNFGVSPLMIGLTIVAFGTSAPEIFVSGAAALQNNPNLAIGNAIGSNIANVGLVLGITALLVPIRIHADIIQHQFPIMFLVMLISLAVFFNDYLGRTEAIVLIALLTLFIIYTVINERKQTPEVDESSVELDSPGVSGSIVWLVVGLILLVISSKVLVWGAVDIAQRFGVSDLIIGLTIIAVGTSLPEVATSVASALKGKPDLAMGNVVGSNIFNLLAVIGTAGIIAPTKIYPDVMERDIPIMFAITIAMVLLATPWRSNHLLTRIGGAILLLGYVTYLGYLIIKATGA